MWKMVSGTYNLEEFSTLRQPTNDHEIRQKSNQIPRRALLKQIFAAATVSLGCLSAGTVLGYSSSGISSLQKESSLHITDNQATWLSGSLVVIGALFGSLLSTPLLVRCGRRKCLLWVCTPMYVFGWALIAGAVHIAMLHIGRLFCGATVGLSITVASLYVVEISDDFLRGSLGASIQVMLSLGMFVSYGLGFVLDWRWLAVTSIVFIIPIIPLLCFIPDSPHWLLANRKKREARESLIDLRGSEIAADHQLKAMEDLDSRDHGHSGIWIFIKWPILKAFMVSLGLMFFQQSTGLTPIIFNITGIFEQSNAVASPQRATILLSIVQFLVAIMAAALVERLGRRTLLALSSALMTASLCALGAYFYLQSRHASSLVTWLPIVALVVYTAAYSMGYGALGWLMVAEILPPSYRVGLHPLVISFGWICAFIGIRTFHDLCSILQYYGTFWLYAGISAIGIAFSLWIVPETKGKSAREIRDHFSNMRSADIEALNEL